MGEEMGESEKKANGKGEKCEMWL